MMVLWWAALAWADPAALRAPVDRPAAVLGAEQQSVAVPVGDRWRVAVETHTGAALGASVGQRWTVLGESEGWGADAVLAGGLLVPVLDPQLGLTVSPAFQGGLRTSGFAGVVGVAAPMVLTVPRVQARLPLLTELQLGGAIGPVWLGGRLAVGPVNTPGVDISAFVEPGLWLAWRGER